MEIIGKYGSAIVYNDDVEQEAVSQIINLLNQPMAQGADVRIMPDCHAGAGCVIGYTAKKTDKIVPNLIGVDIGCGVTGWKLGKRSVVGEKFDKLDKIIRTHVPSGRTINDEVDEEEIETIFNTLDTDYSFRNFFVNVEEVCKRTGQDSNYIWRSAGSLGGGKSLYRNRQRRQ
jgi:tRNA-splicing ligase RtcB